MSRLVLLLPLLAAVACGPAAPAERVAVQGVDRLSGELTGIEVDLPGADLASVRGPAALVVDGASIEGTRVVGGASPECQLRRRASGAWAAQSTRCGTLLAAYAALERGRQFLLSVGAEALLPPVVAASDTAPPGLGYQPAADAFSLGEGPAGARVPAALNSGVVVRELSRRSLRTLLRTHPDEAEGLALFLGAAASADPDSIASSQPGGDPLGRSDLSRPLPSTAGAAESLAGALWAWADASGDRAGAARAAFAAARAIERAPAADPAAVLSLVAAQLEGAERDQACAVFRARLPGVAIAACP